MIKAVIFDFFGVLVTEGFKQFRETHFVGDKTKEEEALDLMYQVDSGLMDMDSFRKQLAEVAGISPQQVSDELGNNKPNKPLLNYIGSELNGRYKLAILSNSSEDYPHKLLDKEDVELFDDILLSYRVGIVKPQREIYELGAKHLGVETSQCVFIDDSKGHCDGAEEAEMKAILYEGFTQTKDELENLLQSAPADN